jgi:tetratricopeptide (TPR) repeat protein
MNSIAAIEASRAKLKPIVELAMRFRETDPSRLSPAEVDHGERLCAMAGKAASDLAVVCMKMALLDEAEALTSALICLEPGNVKAMLRLAEIHRRKGDMKGAALHLAEACRMDAGNAELQFRLGTLHLGLGWRPSARAAFEQSLAIDPGHYGALNELAMFALMDGETEQAGSFLDRALAVRPDGNLALINAAQLDIGIGRPDRANARLDKVLATHPESIDGHVLRARIRTYAPDDAELAVMRRLWRTGGQEDGQRSRLGFALFKALDDIGEADEAFDVLAQANVIRRKGFTAYDVRDDVQLMASLEQAFSPDLVAAHFGRGLKGHAPIFILGLPRSGTSLTEQILASHPEIYGAGELDLVSHSVARHFFDPSRRHLLDIESRLSSESLTAMAQAYLDVVLPKAAPRPRFTDKMPVNYLWVGFILMMFPDARIIHISRDPVANAFALYSTSFDGQGMPYAYDLDDLSTHIGAYQRLMSHWRRVFPGSILDVGYEQLTEDLEVETRRILAFCGLDFDARCLRFHETKRPVMTMSAAQVIKPLYSGRDKRTGKYRKHLGRVIRRLEGDGR